MAVPFTTIEQKTLNGILPLSLSYSIKPITVTNTQDHFQSDFTNFANSVMTNLIALYNDLILIGKLLPSVKSYKPTTTNSGSGASMLTEAIGRGLRDINDIVNAINTFFARWNPYIYTITVVRSPAPAPVNTYPSGLSVIVRLNDNTYEKGYFVMNMNNLPTITYGIYFTPVSSQALPSKQNRDPYTALYQNSQGMYEVERNYPITPTTMTTITAQSAMLVNVLGSLAAIISASANSTGSGTMGEMFNSAGASMASSLGMLNIPATIMNNVIAPTMPGNAVPTALQMKSSPVVYPVVAAASLGLPAVPPGYIPPANVTRNMSAQYFANNVVAAALPGNRLPNPDQLAAQAAALNPSQRYINNLSAAAPGNQLPGNLSFGDAPPITFSPLSSGPGSASFKAQLSVDVTALANYYTTLLNLVGSNQYDPVDLIPAAYLAADEFYNKYNMYVQDWYIVTSVTDGQPIGMAIYMKSPNGHFYQVLISRQDENTVDGEVSIGQIVSSGKSAPDSSEIRQILSSLGNPDSHNYNYTISDIALLSHVGETQPEAEQAIRQAFDIPV